MTAAAALAIAPAALALAPHVIDLIKEVARARNYNKNNRKGRRGHGDESCENDNEGFDDNVEIEKYNINAILSNLKSEISETQLNIDAVHRALLDTDWRGNGGENFYHLMHYLLQKFLSIRDSNRVNCFFCSAGTSQKNLCHARQETIHQLFDYKDHFKAMLVSMYQCSMSTVNLLFHILKPPCNPFSGMYAFELHQVVLTRIKKMNEQLEPNMKIFYHGIIYKNSTTDKLMLRYAAIVNEESYRYSRHFFLFATNTVVQPVHWCFVLIDWPAKLYLHYNPLAKIADSDKRLYTYLSMISHENFDYVHNTGRLQGKSKLCGFFVFDMLNKLINISSNNLRETFLALTSENIEIDKYIGDQTKKFVQPTPSSSFNRFGPTTNYI